MGDRSAGPHRWKLRTRLIVTLTSTLTAILIINTVAAILSMQSFVRDRIDDRLMASSQRIRSSLLDLKDLRMNRRTVERMANAESATVVFDRAGRPILIANAEPGVAKLMMESARHDGRPHRVASRSDLAVIWLDLHGSGFTLVGDDGRAVVPDGALIGFDTRRTLGTARQLILMSAATMLIADLALVAATVIILTRRLRPLKAMSRSARAFAAGDRAARLPIPDEPDLHQLAMTVNAAFDAQERVERRLRSFVADASHELRTPLTIANGWIELYLQGGLADAADRDHAMQRAATQLARMRTLIDELALLARLDGPRPLDLRLVDLTALTSEVVEDAKVIDPDRPISLRAGGPAPLLGDAPKLQQVILNLLGNATKHTPPGTPVAVIVRPAPADGAGSTMHTLLVADRGPGIPPKDREHVFTRFWRRDASRTRPTGGSGLGLAIVSSIVTAHGGTSDVVSAGGPGTTLRVRLPAATSQTRGDRETTGPGVDQLTSRSRVARR